jgi:two-component sensor histidine kinase
LVIHELATNSLKYGSLSAATGTLDVSGSIDGDDVVLAWTEPGGPEVVTPQGAGGYGSRMLERTVSTHLGGTISYNWTPGGALVTLKLDANRLAS